MLKEQMQNDLKTAMKAGDARKKDALRFLSSTIKQVEIDTREALPDDKIISIMQTELKKRRDSLEEFKNAGRMDDVTQQEYEIALITSYLPAQMSADELRAEVQKAVAEAGATTPKDMGAVMKVLMPRVKDRAAGKAIQDAVQAALKGN